MKFEHTMPWFCYVGFNTLVVWNFVTFAFDTSSVLKVGSSLNATSIPWLIFSVIQILCIGIFVIYSSRIQRYLATGKTLIYISPALTSIGAFLMLSPQLELALLGSVCSGFGYAWLWMLSIAFFARLDTDQMEHVITRSIIYSVFVVAFLVILPETIRFFSAQLIPFFLAFCLYRSLAWMPAKAETPITTTNNQKDPESDIQWILSFRKLTNIFQIKDMLGQALPSLFVFLLSPFIMIRVQELIYTDLAVSIIAGFVIAAVLTYLFLLLTPSVDIPFIFRWQVPLIACALMVSELGFSPTLASALLTAALVMVSQFIYIFLCRKAQIHKPNAFKIFLSGQLIFTIGVLLGSILSSLFTLAIDASMLSYSNFGYIVFMAIMIALALMVYVPREEGRADVLTEADLEKTILEKSRNSFYSDYKITKREKEVVGLLAKGRSVPFIRDELVISQNTVNTHIKHIYAKTDTAGKQELLDLMETYLSSNKNL